MKKDDYNKLVKKILVLLIFFLAIYQAKCTSPYPLLSKQSLKGEAKQKFKNYWWKSGKAELNRYDLLQARYGEKHPGTALLVFVTEDFLTDKQVKNESNQKKNNTAILKLNFIKKFPTGIYDYSMMSSVFTPTDTARLPTLKITTSSQEWCGHTYSQLNFSGYGYKYHHRSYFEREGDLSTDLPNAYLEDSLFTTIRIDPANLPKGQFSVIPSTMFLRLRHKYVKAYRAKAQEIKTANYPVIITENFKNLDGQAVYFLEYKNLNRKIYIIYSKTFPYSIQGWVEIGKSGFGPGAAWLPTIAKLTHQYRSPYWRQNGLKDAKLRKNLGL